MSHFTLPVSRLLAMAQPNLDFIELARSQNIANEVAKIKATVKYGFFKRRAITYQEAWERYLGYIERDHMYRFLNPTIWSDDHKRLTQLITAASLDRRATAEVHVDVCDAHLLTAAYRRLPQQHDD